MPKIFKPGDTPEDKKDTGTPIMKPGLNPQPQMTARVAPKVYGMIKENMDRQWNPDEYMHTVRAEYDFKIKMAKPMCDPGVSLRCTKSPTMPFCSWPDYLHCSIRTLEWRRQEIVTNKGTWGGLSTELEIGSVQYLIDLSIDAIKNYMRKGGLSLGLK